MYKNKKAALAIMLAIVMFALAGCGGGQKPASQEPAADNTPNVAIYAYNSEPILNWDPAVMFSNGIIVLNNIYEQLVRYDPEEDKIIPLLAETYSVDDTGLVWTFNLRKGVKFQCGANFTAKDVKNSIERTMDLKMGASFLWDPVESIEVVDDYTVKFNLKYPAPLDVIAAAGYAAFIYHTEHGESEWFEQGNACGTGPYKLESWTRGNEVLLAKFDDYWGGWKDNQFDKALIKMVAETSTRRQMLEGDQTDIVVDLPVEDIQAIKDNPDIDIIETPSFQNMIAFFNIEKEPLNNKLVRQAISYAIPYEQIVDYVLSGYAVQSRGPIPEKLWGHKDDLLQYEHNIEKAKELMKQAGYADGGLKLLLTYMGGEENERKSAELMKAELKKIGIELEIRGMPWDAQWDLAKSPNPKDRQDIFVMYWWPDAADPLSYLRSLFVSEEQILFNMSYFNNKEYDDYVTQGSEMAGIDRAKAIELYGKAQDILMEEAPAAFVYDQMYIRAKNKSFAGYKDNPAYPHVIFFYDTYRDK
jgi:peptide/nickel transport system substrate-binding protein